MMSNIQNSRTVSSKSKIRQNLQIYWLICLKKKQFWTCGNQNQMSL